MKRSLLLIALFAMCIWSSAQSSVQLAQEPICNPEWTANTGEDLRVFELRIGDYLYRACGFRIFSYEPSRAADSKIDAGHILATLSERLGITYASPIPHDGVLSFFTLFEDDSLVRATGPYHDLVLLTHTEFDDDTGNMLVYYVLYPIREP